MAIPPAHPERHRILIEEVSTALRDAAGKSSRELVGTPRGHDRRFGPKRQARNALKLYRRLVERGERVRSVQDLSRTMAVPAREAAAILELASGPQCMRLNPLLNGLVRGTTREVDEFAPVPPQAIVFGAPNSPAPGVHRNGKRVDRDGPTFGVGEDGHQRWITGYLSAAYGLQEQFGYAAALSGWVSPSSRDDEDSARRAGRDLAVAHPARYATAFAIQVVEAVDRARPNERPLPLVFIDGRRDCEPLDGTTLDVRLDTRIEDVDWPVVATIPGDRVKMIEASDPSRPGGLGLNKNLVYHTAGAASQTFSAERIEMGLEGRDGELNDLLISEWRWLPPIDRTLAGEESTSVMVFAGYVSDLRTGHRGRLMAFMSYANQLSYFVIPFEGTRDPFPRLEIPECHTDAHRDISLSARLLVGPSQWTGVCRRNAHLYRDYFYIAAKPCSVREIAFALGVNVRMSDVEFPGTNLAPHQPTVV